MWICGNGHFFPILNNNENSCMICGAPWMLIPIQLQPVLLQQIPPPIRPLPIRLSFGQSAQPMAVHPGFMGQPLPFHSLGCPGNIGGVCYCRMLPSALALPPAHMSAVKRPQQDNSSVGPAHKVAVTAATTQGYYRPFTQSSVQLSTSHRPGCPGGACSCNISSNVQVQHPSTSNQKECTNCGEDRKGSNNINSNIPNISGYICLCCYKRQHKTIPKFCNYCKKIKAVEFYNSNIPNIDGSICQACYKKQRHSDLLRK